MRKDSFDEDFFSLTNKKWSLKEYSEKDTEYISQSYEVSPLVAKLLSIRKVNLDDIISYISPSLKESLPDPYVLADMEKACERLYQAIINKERIAVFGDYDVDGSTSTSTLINYFKQISMRLKFHIPDRFSEGYGPSIQTFSNFKKRDVKIIFTVDCGTMAFSEIEYAREQGMDVVVLDHHIPEIKLPKATAIINPNRMDDNSGLNYLSAVGVTYMFIIGLNRKLRREDWFKKNDLKEPNLIALLDLVALGTVCDAVPLKGLNRILVSKGIDVIQKRLNPGLNSLIEKSNIKSKVSVHDLGFKIGPRINAGGRLGFSNFGTDLLTESEKSKIDSISNDLDKFNSERRTIESYVLDQAIAQVDDKKLKNKLLIVSGEGWHEGVIGIIASRLKDKFNKPSIVFSINNGEAKGSGRSIKGIDLGQLVISAVQSNLLKKGGGHSMAAGLTIESKKIEELEKFFEKQLTNKVINTQDNKILFADDILSTSAINLDVHREIEKIGPFGSENPEPSFIFKNVILATVDQIGEEHFKCLIKSDGGKFIEAMAFRSAKTQLGEELIKNKGSSVCLFGKIKINEWGGKKIPQIHIIDISASQNS